MATRQTTVRVDKQTAKKATRIAAILQEKRGKRVTIGQAVAEAVEKCLAEVA